MIRSAGICAIIRTSLQSSLSDEADVTCESHFLQLERHSTFLWLVPLRELEFSELMRFLRILALWDSSQLAPHVSPIADTRHTFL